MRLTVFLFCLISLPVFAATAQKAPSLIPNGNSGKPVAIEADKQLEWLRGDNKFRATGNVSITQGDTTIKGDTAEALYDPAIGPNALTHMTVTGHVVITAGVNVITSDTAEYDTGTQVANLRGPEVILKSPKATVTAKDGMDYYAAEHKAVSKSSATVVQDKDKIQADQLTAWLTETNELKRATATGHVVITQKTDKGTDIAIAQHGDYDAIKQQAILTGDVKLTQGDNHMQGDKATINMVSGYSSLLSDPVNGKNGGRVRAIFTPGSNGASSFMPSVQTSVPSIKPKQNFEQPYAVGKK